MLQTEELEKLNNQLSLEIKEIENNINSLSKDVCKIKKQKVVNTVWLDFKKEKNHNQIKKSHKRI